MRATALSRRLAFRGAARDLAKELLSNFVKSKPFNLFQNEKIPVLPLRQPVRFTYLFVFNSGSEPKHLDFGANQ